MTNAARIALRLGALLSAGLCACCSSGSRPLQQLANVSVTALNGQSIPIRRYAGHPLWINFFAAWCPPCIAETPSIERIYRAEKGNGLVVVGVDRQESPEIVARFAATHGISYPVTIDDGAAARALEVGTLPVSVFVDADGFVRDVRAGGMSEAAMRAAVASILMPKAAAGNASLPGTFALQSGTPQTQGYLSDRQSGGDPLRRHLDIWMTRPGSEEPIRSYEADMTKLLHAVIVSDDFRTFLHVHPVLQRNGHFTLDQRLPRPAFYQLYADARPVGIGQQVFRFDLPVGVNSRSVRRDLSERSTTVNAGPYWVSISSNTLRAGSEAKLIVHVRTNGRPASDLHPYLGALAHAVFLNAGDLSYVHAHPMPLRTKRGVKMNGMTMDGMDMEMKPLPEASVSAPDMVLHVDLHEAGVYKLWLQFRGGTYLYVAPFIITVRPVPPL